MKTSPSAAIFDQYAAEYQSKHMDTQLYHDSFDRFCAAVSTENAAILEVACGPGNITQYLLSRRPDFQILGTDLAPNMIALAKANNPAASFQLMDSREIGLLDQKFDGIVSGFCFPYLSKEEVEKFVEDAARGLHPEGVLYISTMEDDYEKSGIRHSSKGDAMTMYFYPAAYLTKLLDANGFYLLDLQRKEYPAPDGTPTTDLLLVAKKRHPTEMTFELKSLEHVPVATLTETFNAAFAGYFVPINMTAQQMQDKLTAESVDLRHAVGAFFENKLVAFILFGINEKNGNPASYNAGTGVLPGYRGQQLTEKMYAYALPRLQAQNVHEHQLEVITDNHKAIHIYQKVGYTLERTLLCLKGVPKLKSRETALDIQVLDTLDESLFSAFWDTTPTWQNAFPAIRNLRHLHHCLGAFVQGELAGYLIYSPHNARVKQFAVKKEQRNQGVGSALFGRLCAELPQKEINMLNLDARNHAALAFLEKLSFQVFLRQYEMQLTAYLPNES